MSGRLAVLANPHYEQNSFSLAEQLQLPLLTQHQAETEQGFDFFLAYRDGALKLLDRALLKKGGLLVNIEPRPGEQHSWPAPRKNQFAQAIGKHSQTVVDATTGWAQDALALFRMGFQVSCIERSPVMAALIADGLQRLQQKDWVQRRQLTVPELLVGDSIQLLDSLPFNPDCIYLDPMFPPKRKKSAMAKKSMTLLRDILGDDLDRQQLFDTAFQKTAKRVVVKSPDYAEPLGGKPELVFKGKLLRYDVYLR